MEQKVSICPYDKAIEIKYLELTRLQILKRKWEGENRGRVKYLWIKELIILTTSYSKD